MALHDITKLVDRDQFSTTSTGTGNIVPGSAEDGYQDLTAYSNADTLYYVITSASNSWEVGVGTVTSGPTSLSRDTVLDSSDSGSKISLSGTSTVWVDLPASQAIYGPVHHAKLRQTTSQNYSDDSTETVSFQTNDYTDVGMVSSTSNNTITAKRAGIYQITATASLEDSSMSSSQMELFIMPSKNGTALSDVISYGYHRNTANHSMYNAITLVVKLAVDDVIRLLVYCSGSGDGGGFDSIVNNDRQETTLALTEMR